MEIEEEFISGFCRTCNGGQTVCCEYTMEGDKRTLTFMDCAHDRCVNSTNRHMKWNDKNM